MYTYVITTDRQFIAVVFIFIKKTPVLEIYHIQQRYPPNVFIGNHTQVMSNLLNINMLANVSKTTSVGPNITHVK